MGFFDGVRTDPIFGPKMVQDATGEWKKRTVCRPNPFLLLMTAAFMSLIMGPASALIIGLAAATMFVLLPEVFGELFSCPAGREETAQTLEKASEVLGEDLVNIPLQITRGQISAPNEGMGAADYSLIGLPINDKSMSVLEGSEEAISRKKSFFKSVVLCLSAGQTVQTAVDISAYDAITGQAKWNIPLLEEAIESKDQLKVEAAIDKVSYYVKNYRKEYLDYYTSGRELLVKMIESIIQGVAVKRVEEKSGLDFNSYLERVFPPPPIDARPPSAPVKSNAKKWIFFIVGTFILIKGIKK